MSQFTIKNFRDTSRAALLLQPRTPVTSDSAQSPEEVVLARAGHMSVRLANTSAQIEEALRLRHRVFVEEMGANVRSESGLDRDIFDPYCQHLVVRDDARNIAVGTYRLMEPKAAEQIGCFYTDSEFWLTRLNPIRSSIVELGRSCVDPAYRTGTTIMLLWSGIGMLLSGKGHGYLLGCVSVSLKEDPSVAARIYHRLARERLAPESMRVWPRERLDLSSVETDEVTLPPLMKGYLKAGARLLGEPHVDHDFGCADFPMLLDLSDLAPTHRRRFLRSTTT
jgi:putative hemolysin